MTRTDATGPRRSPRTGARQPARQRQPPADANERTPAPWAGFLDRFPVNAADAAASLSHPAASTFSRPAAPSISRPASAVFARPVAPTVGRPAAASFAKPSAPVVTYPTAPDAGSSAPDPPSSAPPALLDTAASAEPFFVPPSASAASRVRDSRGRFHKIKKK
uniref:Proteophosphoglycan 5 n=1 Tax=Steinernema glaseri TaxID=37863 RepID=A0A1I7YSR6_9BILA